MTAFDLRTRYDTILCLFSSIAYARTTDRVIAALRCFRAHLEPGGLIVVEPWFSPGVLEDGRISLNTAEAPGLKVCRMARTEVDGRVSRLHFQYLVGRPSGITHATEVHELGLFTTEEMLSYFREAGLEARHETEGLIGRGLFLARAV